MFNILNVSANINPKNYNISSNGSLEIEWSEGDHKSSYDPSWLREKLLYFKK
jgi:gamma-butyrobetaine dioxygenase